MMALAETLRREQTQGRHAHLAAGDRASSIPRAKVQLAELYLAENQTDLARTELKDVLADDAHAPTFQRRRDRPWVRARTV